MNEDTINMDIRRFLKQVGINAQREIEHAILHAVDGGRLQGNESITLSMRLEVPTLDIHQTIDGRIRLESDDEDQI